MRPDQFVPLLVLASLLVVLGLVYRRRLGEARGRGWLIAAAALVVAIGAFVMLYPMIGLQRSG